MRTQSKIGSGELHKRAGLTEDGTLTVIYTVGAAIVEQLERLVSAVDTLSARPRSNK